jgi:hypothetical protein
MTSHFLCFFFSYVNPIPRSKRGLTRVRSDDRGSGTPMCWNFPMFAGRIFGWPRYLNLLHAFVPWYIGSAKR